MTQGRGVFDHFKRAQSTVVDMAQGHRVAGSGTFRQPVFGV